MTIGMLLESLGLAAGPVVPTREWRELYGALAGVAAAAIHPQYSGVCNEFAVAGRPVVGSAPVGYEGTAAWLEAIAAACGVTSTVLTAAKNRWLPATREALAGCADQGAHHPVRLRRFRTPGGAPADRERRRPAVCRDGLWADRVVENRLRLARVQGCARSIPCHAGARP